VRQKEKGSALYQKFLVRHLFFRDLSLLFLLFFLRCVWLARTHRRTFVFPPAYLVSDLCLLAKVQDLFERANLTLEVRAVLRLLQFQLVPRLLAQREETTFILFLLCNSSSRVGVERSNGLGVQRSLLRDVGRWQGRGRLWRDGTGARDIECGGEALFWERYGLVRFGFLRSRGAR